MEEKLIECVPNFSEGRDPAIIRLITNAIESVDHVKLLDVDPGAEMNRTVVTFVGDPEGIKEAAFRAIKKAAELIDMSKHKGSHPRMGATDVCPFVPVNGISIEECIEISKEVAKKVGNELNIPVYLYEKSAQRPERWNLAYIRAGEYEALEEKLQKTEWKPDFGPAKFNKKSGATVIGVREFLIAYNINLNTRDKQHATDIAFELREKGRSARTGNIFPYYYKGETILKYNQDNYPCGSCSFTGKTIKETIDHCHKEHKYDLSDLLKLNDIDPQKPGGESVKKPGKFKHCKAIGWYVPEFDRAQISINLTNFNVTPIHHVLEETRLLAAERGLIVTGSEIVGMVPYTALLETGKYYLKKQGRSAGIPVTDILNTAVQSLALKDVAEFDINERVLGLPQNPEEALVELKVSDFVDEVSRESVAPGGGSVAALAGALGVSLASMVANLSSNTRGTEKIDTILNETAETCQEIKQELLRAVDEDTQAYNAFLNARRLPAGTRQEKEIRQQAIQDGLKQAVLVPLNTARQSFRALKLAETAIKLGNPASVTDAAVGLQMAFGAVKSSIYNVLVNLKDISDKEFIKETKQRCMVLNKEAKSSYDTIIRHIEEKLFS